MFLRTLVLDAQPFVLVGLLVVDGNVLHDVGGQVLQHQLAVVPEELLAVEQQGIHKLALMVDASVRLQLHVRQLAQQSIEHGAFGQDEGIGIVDDGVAPVVELHFRGRNGHLLHHLGLRCWVEIEGRQIPLVLAATNAFQRIIDVGRLIAVEADAEKIFRGLGRHDERGLTGFPRECLCHMLAIGFLLLDDGAVRSQQLHAGTEEILVRTDVLHYAVQLQVAYLLLPLMLDVDVLSVHFYLHGQALAHLLYGCHRIQAFYIFLRRQAFQPVRNDVDGVFGLALLNGLENGKERNGLLCGQWIRH